MNTRHEHTRRAVAPQGRSRVRAVALDPRPPPAEEAAVLRTPVAGVIAASTALATSATDSLASAAMAVSAAAEMLGSVASVAEPAAVVAAAVALAAPSEPAAGAGTSEPAATDDTAPMAIDNGHRPRMTTMLSREMALRAEVRVQGRSRLERKPVGLAET